MVNGLCHPAKVRRGRRSHGRERMDGARKKQNGTRRTRINADEHRFSLCFPRQSALVRVLLNFGLGEGEKPSTNEEPRINGWTARNSRFLVSRKFEEMRGRVEQPLAHGFGGLGFGQSSQAFHGCRRFKQEERLFQCADVFCPRGRDLVVSLGEEFGQRRARRGWYRLWRQSINELFASLRVGFAERMNEYRRRAFVHSLMVVSFVSFSLLCCII